MSANSEQIGRNLQAVRDRIAEAAIRSGRTQADIKLVAVTKYVDVDSVVALLHAGCRALGESRPQELWRKSAALSQEAPRQAPSPEWHLIGHLQRNKAQRSLPIVSLIHSIDSLRLLQEIDRCARRDNSIAQVLLEINISGETAKHGFRPQEIESLLPQVALCGCVCVRGLMTMSTRDSSVVEAGREFAQLRELRDSLRGSCPDSIQLDDLSMGMSRDYEVAIEEGATIVRVGSALYGTVV